MMICACEGERKDRGQGGRGQGGREERERDERVDGRTNLKKETEHKRVRKLLVLTAAIYLDIHKGVAVYAELTALFSQ